MIPFAPVEKAVMTGLQRKVVDLFPPGVKCFQGPVYFSFYRKIGVYGIHIFFPL